MSEFKEKIFPGIAENTGAVCATKLLLEMFINERFASV